MRKKVLLVEDTVEDRNMYGNILWYNGYDTLYAADGAAALKIIQDEHPDLVVLDLELPRIHGSEVASRMKQDDTTKNIPIIALTGRRLREFGGNAAILGYSEFLEKPASPLELLRCVERLIGRATDDQAVVTQRAPVVSAEEEQEEPEEQKAEEPVIGEITTELQRIGAHLRANAAGVCHSWEQLVLEEPWFSLPRDDRLSNLTDLITMLANAALISPQDHDARRRIVLAAAEHGSNRRMHGIPETLIPIEFHLLRRAIWRYLGDSWVPAQDSFSAILSIDALVTLALNSAMWGYYRDEVAGQVAWEDAIERLVSSTSFDIEPA